MRTKLLIIALLFLFGCVSTNPYKSKMVKSQKGWVYKYQKKYINHY